MGWKGRLGPKISDVPVSSLDLFPSILKACEVRAPADLPGLDLADESALVARPALCGECYTHDFVDLHEAAPNLRWRWILQGGWKLIFPAPQNEKGGAELYYVNDDPREEKNLAGTEVAPSRISCSKFCFHCAAAQRSSDQQPDPTARRR